MTTRLIISIETNNKICILGSKIDHNIILSTGIDTLPVTIPVNAITFATGGGNSGTWRVSNNQGRLVSKEDLPNNDSI